jgi:hypothetical protein
MSFSDLWNSVERLGSLNTLANWGIAATLLMAFACTVVAIKTSSRKDELIGAEDLRKAEHIADLDHANLTLRGQVATLEMNAANANKDLAGLQKAASDAKAAQQKVETELAKQQERAANAERALLKLQEHNKPRHLAAEQQQNVATKLKQFAGQKINLLAYSDDGEIIGLTNNIGNALAGPGGAGWVISASLGSVTTSAISGILIEVTKSADSQARLAADSIVAALRSEGLDVTGPNVQEQEGFIMGNIHVNPSAMIWITIGRKP